MNCSRFRFLIQQWFDAPLSAQDERMLVSHIESCDSCARFQHQLDQVVQGTPDVALPDDCLPSNLEALAKRIMVEIPQEKPGILSFFKNLFGGAGGGSKKAAPSKAPMQKGASKAPPQAVQSKGKAKGKGKQEAPAPVEMPMSDDSLNESNFPHVRRRGDEVKPVRKSGAASASAQSGVNAAAGAGAGAVDEELLATSTRLKNLQQKLQPIQDEPQAQSQGLSLGTKFGMNVPMRDSAAQEDAPLTLAESIRRKMVEDKATGENQQITSGSQNFSQPQPQAGGFGGFAQPGQANFAGDGAQFAPPPGFGSTFGQPGSQPSPQGQPPQNLAQSSGNNPMVGQWGDAAAQPAPQAPNSWTDPPRPGVGGDNDWKPQPPNTDWSAGRAPNSSFPQPQAPGSVPQPLPGDNQWANAGGNGNWGDPNKPQGAAPNQQPPQAPVQNWAQPQAPGWGDPPQPQAPAAQAAPQNWGQPQGSSGGQAAPGWNNQAASGHDLQGQSQAQVQPQSVVQPQPAPTAQGWGQPQQNSWGNQAPADPGWAQPQAQPQAPPAQPAADGWATAGGAGNNGWNQAAPAQPAGWGQQSPQGQPQQPQLQSQPQPQPQQGWGAQGGAQPPGAVNPFLTSTPAPASPVQPGQGNEFEAWSEEGEQIQTGMWQAFNMDQPEIGQPRADSGSQRPGGLPIANKPSAEMGRFESPIQQRGESANLAAAAAGKGDPAMFDIPIQERMKMQQQQAVTADAGARWDMPNQQRPAQQEAPAYAAPSAVPPAQGQNKSIMDRLNKVLGDDLAAMAAANPNAAQPWGTVPAATAASAPASYASPQQGVPQPVPPMQAQPQPQPQPQPMIPQPQPASFAPQAAPAQDANSGLFSLNDQQIDKVFRENLGVSDPARPVGGPAPQQAAPPQAMPPQAVPPVPAMQQQAPNFGGPRITAVPPRTGEMPMPQSQPQPQPVQPFAAPAPPQPAPAPPPQMESSGLLKGLDDRAMDQIFANNLGVKDANANAVNQAPPVQPTAPVPPMQQMSAPFPAAMPPMQPLSAPIQPAVPPMQQMSAPSQAAVPPQSMPQQPGYPSQVTAAQAARASSSSSGLLNVDDDAMDRIFADLGVKDKMAAANPKINVREAVNQIRNIADVPAPPKVEGISRLGREEVVSDPTPGKINAIGKFLLDQQDLAKIGKLTEEDLSDTKVRVLTHEASDEINRLLAHIAVQPGVVGSVIVGHDGILIANSLPRELDPETIGILSLGIYFNTTNTTKKMQHNHLHQLVCRTHMGFLVIADFGGGILVTVSNELAIEKLIPLMRSITQLVAQS